jgi:hypothetical protein
MNQIFRRASITYEHTSFRADICGLHVSFLMAYRNVKTKISCHYSIFYFLFLIWSFFRSMLLLFLLTSKCLNQWKLGDLFQMKGCGPTSSWWAKHLATSFFSFFTFIRLAMLKLLATNSSTIYWTREIRLEWLIPLQHQCFLVVYKILISCQ